MADDKAPTAPRASASQSPPSQEAKAEEEATEGELPAQPLPLNAVHPYELPANTAAARAFVAANPAAVSEDVPISDERIAQSQAAVQAHQDSVQAVVDQVGADPRLNEAAPNAWEVEEKDEKKEKAKA